MGDGTKEKPYTRKDVLRRIKANGGTAEGLDLSGKMFEAGIELQGLDLPKIILKDAIFLDAHLEGAYLVGARLEGAYLGGAHLEGTILVNARLEGADLINAHLEGALLTNAHLEGTYLEDAEWGNFILGEEKEAAFQPAAYIYRRLKQWHTNAGMYNIAGEFFFREMTVKRKMLQWWPNPLPRIWSKFLSLICGYGERPVRVIGWAASVVVGLALIYFIIGLTWEWSAFWRSLYFSAVSFTALGYGSWLQVTNDWLKAIGAFESFVGVFMIALFLVTFTRKMIR